MHTPWVSFYGKDCSGCKHLNDRGYCEFTACIIPCTVSATIPDSKPQTNADRIRAMTDEELARYIVHLVKQGNRQAMADYECGLNWLKDKCDEWSFDWLKKWGGT